MMNLALGFNSFASIRQNFYNEQYFKKIKEFPIAYVILPPHSVQLLTMLQRIQTLYLIGALIVNFLYLFVPINTSLATSVSITSDILLSIVSLTMNGLLLFTIFSFKNRKRQMMLCKLIALGISVELLLTILLVVSGSIYWNFSLPIIAIVFIALAFRSINSDDKLVRSADRLR
jgi:hypothetical protein